MAYLLPPIYSKSIFGWIIQQNSDRNLSRTAPCVLPVWKLEAKIKNKKPHLPPFRGSWQESCCTEAVRGQVNTLIKLYTHYNFKTLLLQQWNKRDACQEKLENKTKKHQRKKKNCELWILFSDNWTQTVAGFTPTFCRVWILFVFL